MAVQGVSLTVYGRSDVGRVRATNQDVFVVADLAVSEPMHAMDRPVELEVGHRGTLLAVSDGMGGAQAGEIASALTLHALRREMMSVRGSAEVALQTGVERANQQVFLAAAEPGRKGMGATVTAVFICGNYAYVAEVGDSRAYVLRGNRLVQVTHDQSYVQFLVDVGTLTPEQAATFPNKNVIAQAIGTKPTVLVAMNRFALRRKDRILLCSDGLSGQLDDAEIQGIIAGSAALDAACSELVDKANAHGGEDNITVILAEMDGEGLPASIAEGRVSMDILQAFTSANAGVAFAPAVAPLASRRVPHG